MDVEAAVSHALRNWAGDGERAALLSTLTPLLTNISSPSPLSTALCTLLSAVAPASSPPTPAPSPPPALPPQEAASLLKDLKHALPSSSSFSSSSPEMDAYMDLVLDLVWTVDTGLEDGIADVVSAGKKEEAGSGSGSGMEVDMPEGGGKAEGTMSQAELEESRRRLAELVKALVGNETITHALAIERLEQPLAIMAGLIRDSQYFERKTRLKRTNLLYKQTKFNLLREESEGYSKLLTELFSSSSGERSPAEAWARITSLIGFFDLDPHRVLDIILDVMEVNITTRWEWFLELLRMAGWAKYEVGRRAGRAGRGGEAREKGMEEEEEEEWLRESRWAGMELDEILKEAEDYEPLELTEVEKKTDVPAQLCGVKLAGYNQPDSPGPKKEFYFMLAILIREGIISLPAIYPHLTPSDEEMSLLEERHKQTLLKQAAPARAANALSLAAPLTEDGPDMRSYRPRLPPTSAPSAPAPPPTASTQPKAPEVNHNNKMGLARALLSVGALRPSLLLVARNTWMFASWPALADLWMRLLSRSLDPLYARISLAARYPAQTASNTRPKNTLAGAGGEEPEVVQTEWAPEPPRTGAQRFEFFYGRWAEWVPLCEVSGDLVVLLEPLMRFPGVMVYRDLVFVEKLTRVGRAMMAHEDYEMRQKGFWRYMLKTYLLPALSFSRYNAAFSLELWSLIRLFDITERWAIYADWRRSYDAPELRGKRVAVEGEVNKLLQRVASVDATRTDKQAYDAAYAKSRQLMRDFGKISHANPCLVFRKMLGQVEAYDNLNAYVAELTRLLSPLSYDVLVYYLLDMLTDVERERVKEDGATPAAWLQSLGNFMGHLFYTARPGSIDFSVILQFLANEWKTHSLGNLVVFRELISKTSGIDTYAHLSDAQAWAMAGGKMLRVEGTASNVFGCLADKPQMYVKSSERFYGLLLSSGMALPLLVLLAQLRQLSCFKREERETIQNLAEGFDACQRVLFQYIEFLSTSPAPKGANEAHPYVNLVPSLPDLCIKYQIEPCIAFHMLRPKLGALVTARAQAEAAEAQEAALREKVKAAVAGKTDTVSPPKQAPPAPAPAPAPVPAAAAPTHENGDAMDVDPPAPSTAVDAPSVNGTKAAEQVSAATEQSADAAVANGVTAPTVAPAPISPWHPDLEPLFEGARSVLPPHDAEILGPAFYVTFWQLSLYDIYQHPDRYNQETSRLVSLDRSTRHDLTEYERAKRLPSIPADAAIQNEVQYTLRKRQLPRYTQTHAALMEESKQQISWISATKRRLTRERDHWFSHIKSTRDGQALTAAVLQHCLFPRVLLSPMDASFCAKLIRLIHGMGTKQFLTLRLYDRILSEQSSELFFALTESEVRNWARFIRDILTDLHVWYLNERRYDTELLGVDKTLLPGFQKKWSVAGEVTSRTELLSHPEFKRAVHKFHNTLKVAFQKCFESMEYLHIRNAIIFLSEIESVFPVMPMSAGNLPFTTQGSCGYVLDNRLKAVIAVEKREELKILAQGYHARLLHRKDKWMIPEKSIPSAPAPAARPRAQDAKPPAAPAANGIASLPKPPGQLANRAQQPPTAPKPGGNVPAGTPTGPSATNAARPAPSNVNSVPLAPPKPVESKTSTTSAAPVATKTALESIPKPDVIKRRVPSGATPPAPQAPLPASSQPVPGQPASAELAGGTTSNGLPSATTTGSAQPTPVASSDVAPSVPALTGPQESARASGKQPEAVPAVASTGRVPGSQAESPSEPSARGTAEAQSTTVEKPKDAGPEPDSTRVVMQPPLGPSSTPSAQEYRATAQSGPGMPYLPPRPPPENELRANGGRVPISPSRAAPTSPRPAPPRRRSVSPEPRRGRGISAEDSRGVRNRINDRPERDDRDMRYPREPVRDLRGTAGPMSQNRDLRSPRDYQQDHRPRPPGDFHDDGRRDPRAQQERPMGRDVDRPSHLRDRERPMREMDRERDDRERGKERLPHGRDFAERDRERRGGPRDSRRDQPSGPPPGPDMPKRDDTRRPSAEQPRRKTREDDEREPRRRDRHATHERDRTPSDKAERRSDRERDRGRKEPRPETDYGPINSVPPLPINTASAPPTAPTAPRSMNLRPPPSPSQARWEPSDRPPPPHLTSNNSSSNLPPRPLNSPEGARRDDGGRGGGRRRDPSPVPPPSTRGRGGNGGGSGSGGSLADRLGHGGGSGSGGTLADRLGPRLGDNEGPSGLEERLDSRKRTFSERDDAKDDSGEHKRPRRIDRAGAKERSEQKEPQRGLFGRALKDTQQDNKERGSRRGGGRGAQGQDA